MAAELVMFEAVEHRSGKTNRHKTRPSRPGDRAAPPQRSRDQRYLPVRVVLVNVCAVSGKPRREFSGDLSEEDLHVVFENRQDRCLPRNLRQVDAAVVFYNKNEGPVWKRLLPRHLRQNCLRERRRTS